MLTPNLAFALVSAGLLAVLWATRMPASPLGGLANIPMRPWALVVLGLMAGMALRLAIGSVPFRWTGSSVHANAATRAPNIVLIVWDTTRADHFSAYGYFRHTTPNVDQLAKHGVLFENAISPSSWTLPAMASILTSLLPHQHGAGADLVIREMGPGRWRNCLAWAAMRPPALTPILTTGWWRVGWAEGLKLMWIARPRLDTALPPLGSEAASLNRPPKRGSTAAV